MMTVERAREINEWLSIRCRKCIKNDNGMDFPNCQVECKVKKMLEFFAFIKKIYKEDMKKGEKE